MSCQRSAPSTPVGRVPVAKILIERRAAPRVRISEKVSFTGPQIAGIGQLRDLSLSGALIGAASVVPPCWSRIRVSFATEWAVRLSITATVVRHQEDGFAVMFTSLNPVTERILRALVRSGDAY